MDYQRLGEGSSSDASRRRKNKKQKETEVRIGNLIDPAASSSSDISSSAKADTSKAKRIERYDPLWFVVGIVFVVAIASLTWEITHYVPILTSPVSLLSQSGSW